MNPCARSEEARSWRRAFRLGLAGAALMAAGCSDDLDPLGFAPVPCEAEKALDAAAVAHIEGPMLRDALEDAAGRIAASLTDRSEGAQLQVMLTDAAERIESMDASCRSLRLARSTLERLPDDPATRPDREILFLVLDVAESSLPLKR